MKLILKIPLDMRESLLFIVYLSTYFSLHYLICRVAAQFYSLLQQLWRQQRRNAIRPASLKNVMGKVYEPFGGHEQQDSHEFLGVFMDALHEDVNRVYKIFYVNIRLWLFRSLLRSQCKRRLIILKTPTSKTQPMPGVYI
jgi:uncharacterized UBP type Zn finger protein